MDQGKEKEYLLYCLGIGKEEPDSNVAPNVSLERLSVDDWDLIIQESLKHSVTPLLYQNLGNANVSSHVPPEVMQKLRGLYLGNATKNMRLYNELSRVLNMLKGEDIDVIVLKGGALAELIYKNIALRPMLDIDLLIKHADIRKIEKILTQNGYKSDLDLLLLSKRHINWIRHIAYISPALQIEAHPKIFELPNLDPWLSARNAKIASNDVLILGPEDFLLHLLVHLVDHLYIREETVKLIWWFDIVKILDHYRDSLNWDYVLRVIKDHHIEKYIYGILYIIHNELKGNLHIDVINRLKISDANALSLIEVINKRQTPRWEPDSLLSYVPVISSIPSLHDKIYHIFRIIFPCRNYIMHHYSVKSPDRVYIYYFIRMWRGITKAVKFLLYLPSYITRLKTQDSRHKT